MTLKQDSRTILGQREQWRPKLDTNAFKIGNFVSLTKVRLL